MCLRLCMWCACVRVCFCMYKCACVYEWCVAVCDDVPPPPAPVSTCVRPTRCSHPVGPHHHWGSTGHQRGGAWARSQGHCVPRHPGRHHTLRCQSEGGHSGMHHGWRVLQQLHALLHPTFPPHRSRVLCAHGACAHVAIVCTCACVRWVSTLHVLVDVRGGNLMYPVACACVVRV